MMISHLNRPFVFLLLSLTILSTFQRYSHVTATDIQHESSFSSPDIQYVDEHQPDIHPQEEDVSLNPPRSSGPRLPPQREDSSVEPDKNSKATPVPSQDPRDTFIQQPVESSSNEDEMDIASLNIHGRVALKDPGSVAAALSYASSQVEPPLSSGIQPPTLPPDTLPVLLPPGVASKVDEKPNYAFPPEPSSRVSSDSGSKSGGSSIGIPSMGSKSRMAMPVLDSTSIDENGDSEVAPVLIQGKVATSAKTILQPDSFGLEGDDSTLSEGSTSSTILSDTLPQLLPPVDPSVHLDEHPNNAFQESLFSSEGMVQLPTTTTTFESTFPTSPAKTSQLVSKGRSAINILSGIFGSLSQEKKQDSTITTSTTDMKGGDVDPHPPQPDIPLLSNTLPELLPPGVASHVDEQPQNYGFPSDPSPSSLRKSVSSALPTKASVSIQGSLKGRVALKDSSASDVSGTSDVQEDPLQPADTDAMLSAPMLPDTLPNLVPVGTPGTIPMDETPKDPLPDEISNIAFSSNLPGNSRHVLNTDQQGEGKDDTTSMEESPMSSGDNVMASKNHLGNNRILMSDPQAQIGSEPIPVDTLPNLLPSILGDMSGDSSSIDSKLTNYGFPEVAGATPFNPSSPAVSSVSPEVVVSSGTNKMRMVLKEALPGPESTVDSFDTSIPQDTQQDVLSPPENALPDLMPKVNSESMQRVLSTDVFSVEETLSDSVEQQSKWAPSSASKSRMVSSDMTSDTFEVDESVPETNDTVINESNSTTGPKQEEESTSSVQSDSPTDVLSETTSPTTTASSTLKRRPCSTHLPQRDPPIHLHDVVFILDTSRQMEPFLDSVSKYVELWLENASYASTDGRDRVDVQVAIVTFGGPPSLRMSFTNDMVLFQSTLKSLSQIQPLSSTTTTSTNSDNNPTFSSLGTDQEAGLEAIRVTLSRPDLLSQSCFESFQNSPQRSEKWLPPVSDAHSRDSLHQDKYECRLKWREHSTRGIFFMTDEDSDLPTLLEMREPKQSSGYPSTPIPTDSHLASFQWDFIEPVFLPASLWKWTSPVSFSSSGMDGSLLSIHTGSPHPHSLSGQDDGRIDDELTMLEKRSDASFQFVRTNKEVALDPVWNQEVERTAQVIQAFSSGSASVSSSLSRENSDDDMVVSFRKTRIVLFVRDRPPPDVSLRGRPVSEWGDMNPARQQQQKQKQQQQPGDSKDENDDDDDRHVIQLQYGISDSFYYDLVSPPTTKDEGSTLTQDSYLVLERPFSPTETLSRLVSKGLQDCLQARLLLSSSSSLNGSVQIRVYPIEWLTDDELLDEVTYRMMKQALDLVMEIPREDGLDTISNNTMVDDSDCDIDSDEDTSTTITTTTIPTMASSPSSTYDSNASSSSSTTNSTSSLLWGTMTGGLVGLAGIASMIVYIKRRPSLSLGDAAAAETNPPQSLQTNPIYKQKNAIHDNPLYIHPKTME